MFSHVVNGADMGIVQRGCDVCFALKALLRAGFCSEMRGQNLDGDISIKTRVTGTVHFTHAASANGRFDPIWAQPGARGQVHRVANYRLGIDATESTAAQSRGRDAADRSSCLDWDSAPMVKEPRRLRPRAKLRAAS